MGNANLNENEVSLKSTHKIYELCSITSRRDWLSFIALFIGTMFLLIWSIWGSINTTVIGKGMLLKSRGINTVSTNANGNIERFNVDIGRNVNVGDVIAFLAQNELFEKIQNLEVEIQNTKKRNNERQDIRDIHEANLLGRVNDLSNQIKSLEKIENKSLEDQNNLINSKEKLSETQNALEKIAIESLEDIQALNTLEREKNALELKYEQDTKVISPYNGVIIDIFNAPGDHVKQGDDIATIEQTGKAGGELEVILFFPAIEGKKIALDSLLKIDLSNIKSKQYGYVKSKVKYVSPYPTTFKGMMRVLQNENLVNEILKEGPQVQVIGELIKDPNNYSGYAWTSVNGAHIQLQTGTFCNGEIDVESSSPIKLVFPR